jgi:RimJ/RimL family protein N-acetyltransferase
VEGNVIVAGHDSSPRAAGKSRFRRFCMARDGYPLASMNRRSTDTYRGPDVFLRPLTPADVDHIVAWRSDPELLKYLSARTPTSRGEIEAEIRRATSEEATDQHPFMICRSADGEPIGTAALHAIDHKSRNAAVDIAIGVRSAWGHGLGTAALELVLDYGFQELRLWRIWLLVYAYNERAIRSYTKVGFMLEGTFRQALYRSGRFHDVLEMGMLAPEWRNRRETRASSVAIVRDEQRDRTVVAQSRPSVDSEPERPGHGSTG